MIYLFVSHANRFDILPIKFSTQSKINTFHLSFGFNLLTEVNKVRLDIQYTSYARPLLILSLPRSSNKNTNLFLIGD
jgi:hypothetical protein